MSTVTTGNLAMGPGTLYVGDFGATEPADTAVSSAPSSATWRDVGGTMGGITYSLQEEFTGLEVDQIPLTAESRRTGMTFEVKVKLAEVTLDNLQFALNLANSAQTSGSGYEKLSPVMDDSSATPNYKAIIFDGIGVNGKRRRVIVRKVLNTDTVAIEATKDGQQGFQCTLKAHYVSSSIKPFDVVDQV